MSKYKLNCYEVAYDSIPADNHQVKKLKGQFDPNVDLSRGSALTNRLVSEGKINPSDITFMGLGMEGRPGFACMLHSDAENGIFDYVFTSETLTSFEAVDRLIEKITTEGYNVPEENLGW